MFPSITCLCPTYGRPRLLMNAVACFMSQDYPPERCKLLILDDLGTINPYVDLARPFDAVTLDFISRLRRIEIHSTQMRFPSLPEKYNAAWRIGTPSDIYVVWEDDDAQLPWCLKSHAAALEHKPWSQPSEVWSDYAGQLHTEPTGGRFHGSLAFRRTALEQIGGWPLTRRADFDQQLMAKLREAFGEPGDPLRFSPRKPLQFIGDSVRSPEATQGGREGDWRSSSYVFRWAHGYHHGQTEMRSPDDEDWYYRYQPPDRSGPHSVFPQMDEHTKAFYRVLAPASRVG